MRNRGQVYWEWANPELHFRNCDERLSCGTLINIQVRTSKQKETQLFYGVYGEKGVMLHEMYIPNCQGHTMTSAVAWALDCAKAFISEQATAALRKSSVPNKSRTARPR